MKPIIKIENLSKQYRLGAIGSGTIREDLHKWWYKISGKEDPYLDILRLDRGSYKDKKENSQYVWSLKDISFEVMPGEVIGIIGKNGAGKSTLLKILSKVTGPTTGKISYNGRIGSLLEVGTGFHPDLTGKENIFLNGAILGMTKREIKAKLDKIVDFSGCERYIDTPVKRYSSGMIVRLGFAVAAHLDPEILIVDEVLAVGDMEFQKKAISKMEDVSRSEGRTILFVSHNMQAIAKLCSRGIVLDNGYITENCGITEAIRKYSDFNLPLDENIEVELPVDRDDIKAYSTKIQIENSENEAINSIRIGQPWKLKINFSVNFPMNSFIIGVNISNLYTDINTTWSDQCDLKEGNYQAIFQNNLTLSPGKYTVTVGLSDNRGVIQYLPNSFSFIINELHDAYPKNKILIPSYASLILNQNEVEIIKVL